MDREIFTVGQGYQCDLWLSDKSQGGASITLLEITGDKGAVKFNGKICPKRSTLPFRVGDEVIFSSSGRHAYVDSSESEDEYDASPDTLSEEDVTIPLSKLRLGEHTNGASSSASSQVWRFASKIQRLCSSNYTRVTSVSLQLYHSSATRYF